MRLPTVACAILLLSSLLANAVLLLREGARRSTEREPARAPEEEAQTLSQSAVERDRNVALVARIRELESALAAVPPGGPAGPSRESRGSHFREKIRRSLPLIGNLQAWYDPESSLAMSEASMDFYRASVRRGSDPATYGDCLKELFEAVLQDGKLSLSEAQGRELGPILKDYREALLRVPSASVAERNLRDLEIEALAMGRARDRLDPEQYSRLRETIGGVGLFSQMAIHGLPARGTDAQIVRGWTEAYHLEEAQIPAALAAAQTYAETLRRIEAQYRGKEEARAIGSAGYYDGRVRSAQAQFTALQRLENVLTPAQKERMGSRVLIDFYVQEETSSEDEK